MSVLSSKCVCVSLCYSKCHCVRVSLTLYERRLDGGIAVPQARNQQRLDGGIAVNICDRIHEACAYDVSSTNGESFSNTRSPNKNEIPKKCRFS